MPLTPKGSKILRAMEQEYGAKKGKAVFYASANKGTISGVHRSPAENVAAYNDTALGETPPRVNIETGHPGADALPSAVGRPAGVVENSGLDNPRADTQTLQAGYLSTPSGTRNKWPAVNSFDGESV